MYGHLERMIRGPRLKNLYRLQCLRNYVIHELGRGALCGNLVRKASEYKYKEKGKLV